MWAHIAAVVRRAWRCLRRPGIGWWIWWSASRSNVTDVQMTRLALTTLVNRAMSTTVITA